MTQRWVHAFQHDALGQDDATAIAKRIVQGELTAEEAVTAAITRVQSVEPALNALQYRCFDQARMQASEQDHRRRREGFFAGVPTVVKDNIDTKGIPTQHGTTAFEAKPAKRDDPFYKQFKAQGFIVVGKSRMPEFGFSGSTEYQDGTAVHNPWNTDYTAGGSSGGSAALVAAGAVPLAHGNDGGGSIRIPAACCGLVGLKVSRNRYVNSLVSKRMPVNMVSDGVITRTVRDSAQFLYQAEQYFHQKRYPRVGLVTGPQTRRLKIGLQLQAISGEYPDEDTQRVVHETADLLRQLGHQVIEIPPPLSADFVDAFMIYYGFMGFALHHSGKLIFDRRFDTKKLDNLSRGLRQYYLKHAASTPRALQQYHQSKQNYLKAMQGLDAVLSPVLGYSVPKLGYLSPAESYEVKMPRLMRFAAYTPLQNTLGTPAISLPMGETTDQMPVGIQLAAQRGEEGLLLALAYELELARPFRKISDFAPPQGTPEAS